MLLRHKGEIRHFCCHEKGRAHLCAEWQRTKRYLETKVYFRVRYAFKFRGGKKIISSFSVRLSLFFFWKEWIVFLPPGTGPCGLLSLAVWRQSLSSNLRIPVSPQIGSVRRTAATYRTGGEWHGKSGGMMGRGEKGQLFCLHLLSVPPVGGMGWT